MVSRVISRLSRESGSCDFPGGGFGRSMISPGMLVLVLWADEGICGRELSISGRATSTPILDTLADLKQNHDLVTANVIEEHSHGLLSPDRVERVRPRIPTQTGVISPFL